MSKTSKSVTADKTALRQRNANAIKAKFPKAKLLTQFAAMAEATGSEAEAAEAKRRTAFIVCQSAQDYREAAFGTGKGQTNDVSTILDCWRDHWKTLIAELHVNENPFVELGEPNREGDQKPVMTGYGRNVASAARGIIEYDIPVIDKEGKERAYTDLTKSVTTERRASLPEDKRTVNASKEELATALADMRKQLGNSADAIACFTSLVIYANEVLTEHGSDGLAAIGLALDDTEIAKYLTLEVEEEKTEADDDVAANDTEEVETSEDEVEIAAA